MTRLYDAYLQPDGLTFTQYSLLAHLLRDPSPSIHELAAMMGMDRTSLTRTLAPLTTRGMVAFGAGADRRSKLVRLTEEGRRIHSLAKIHWRAAQEEIQMRLGADELGQLHRLLDHAFERLEHDLTLSGPGSVTT